RSGPRPRSTRGEAPATSPCLLCHRTVTGGPLASADAPWERLWRIRALDGSAGASVRSRHVFRQYRGVHADGRRPERSLLPDHRRDPDVTGRPRLPPDEPRPLPRRGGDLRAAVLDAGPAAADLLRPRGERGRRELDGGCGDLRTGAVRAADERPVRALRP